MDRRERQVRVIRRKPQVKRSVFNPKRWLGNIVFVILDLLPNVLTGGSSTESMSSRMGRAIVLKSKGFGGWLSRTLCRGLDLIDRGHCVDTYEFEKSMGLHRPESLDDKPGD